MRAGLWRALDALAASNIVATFFFCGRAVERVPVLVAEVVRRGHEPAVHGWRWRPHADYATGEAEAHDLDRTVATIAAATGVRPRGFFCRGSESIHTRSLLRERGFLYRLLNIGFHLRIVGRPARFPALTGVLDLLVARRDRLWIATRAAIAEAFAKAVPHAD
jgi:peptidoglycan/xylan/chitin deacetylase (PgdA/CDA1 family)